MILRPALAAALLLSGLVLGGTATASPAADTTFASGSGSGSRWTAATVQSDGGRLRSQLDLRGATSPVVLSYRVFVDGKRVATTNYTLRAAGGGRGVLVDAKGAAGIRVEVDRTEDDSAFRFANLTASVTVNPESPSHKGRVSVVLYAATTEVDGWAWTLSGSASNKLLGSSSGPEAFAYTARDFGDSDLSVYAGHSVPDVATAHARVNQGATRSLVLNPRLMGAYTTFGTDRLTVTGPGYRRECTPGCDFDPERPADRIPHTSQYVFTLDGSSTGVRGPSALQQADTDISLHGAHVRPPHGGAF